MPKLIDNWPLMDTKRGQLTITQMMKLKTTAKQRQLHTSRNFQSIRTRRRAKRR